MREKVNQSVRERERERESQVQQTIRKCVQTPRGKKENNFRVEEVSFNAREAEMFESEREKKVRRK